MTQNAQHGGYFVLYYPTSSPMASSRSLWVTTMTEVLRITYINCDFCTAKNHCAACGSELEQSLTES